MNATGFHESSEHSGQDRLPQVLFAAYVVVWVLTAIKPFNRQDWLLENLLVFAAVPGLAFTYPKFRFSDCSDMLITVYLILHAIGGHTEITNELERPILVGTLIGEVEQRRLITPRGARPGDRILLTNGVPIEATAILAREFPERLPRALSAAELRQALSFLRQPGISVVRDAQIALRAGPVTAMHDPTEGGLVTALWELAEASGRPFCFDPSAVPIPKLAARVCRAFALDPLRAIASGALLLTAPTASAGRLQRALESEGIVCAEIGVVERGPAGVWQISRDRRVRVKPRWKPSRQRAIPC